MQHLLERTTLSVYVSGVRYCIAPSVVAGTFAPYEIHVVDARGNRRRVRDLSAEVPPAVEFYLLCLSSALREGIEFAKNPPQGDDGDDGDAGDDHQGDDGDDGDAGDDHQGDDDDDDGHEAALNAAVAAVGASIGRTLHPRANSDRSLCQHPNAFPVLSADSESCPDCGAYEPLGSL